MLVDMVPFRTFIVGLVTVALAGLVTGVFVGRETFKLHVERDMQRAGQESAQKLREELRREGQAIKPIPRIDFD